MVAKGADLEDVRQKAMDINKKLGDKLEIPDSELTATVEACRNLMLEGEDLSSGSALAADRMIAEAE